ncbi:MAG: 23S rRNA (guanosine(2251)-2'-O)-methyltransferase RlmB [Hyphomicrobiales bacterium]|nr:MAG: 23S rRNA (guanosine(2251)-2'-O)-methyltransferase RlmB [Hyphomicrobiales bacterium]
MTRPPSNNRKQRPHRRKPGTETAEGGPALLYGLHTVASALANPARTKLRLIATRNALARLPQELIPADLPIEIVNTPKDIDRRVTADAVHQGVLLEAEPLPERDLTSLGKARLVLILDQTTDPHNVGAIMRSAAAFAVDAIILPRRHSASETGVLAKSASGALDLVPLISVGSLADAIEQLKKEGFLCVGFDSEGPKPFEDVDLKAPLALVMGSEGKGLRPRTQEVCSELARLDMPGEIKSLNVSNATALALYIASRALG